MPPAMSKSVARDFQPEELCLAKRYDECRRAPVWRGVEFTSRLPRAKNVRTFQQPIVPVGCGIKMNC